MSRQVDDIGNTVYYWLEPVIYNTDEYYLFTAVCRHGLLMSGLGKLPESEARYREDLEMIVKRYLPDYVVRKEKSANSQILNEFKEYFDGQRSVFTYPLCPKGTAFQLRVWEELRTIPYGETRSYSEIARAVQSPNGQRAVGMANHKNPLGIAIPCHRVIGKNRQLVGYAGGLEIKAMLLELEKAERPD